MGVKTINLSGRGDMGSYSNPMTPPRFSLPVKVYTISGLRITFAGGSGSATLKLGVDHRFGPSYDRTVFEFPGVGSGGAGVEWRVEETERDTFLFFWDEERNIRDELVLIWTDPDVGDATTWAVSVELREVDDA